MILLPALLVTALLNAPSLIQPLLVTGTDTPAPDPASNLPVTATVMLLTSFTPMVSGSSARFQSRSTSRVMVSSPVLLFMVKSRNTPPVMVPSPFSIIASVNTPPVMEPSRLLTVAPALNMPPEMTPPW